MKEGREGRKEALILSRGDSYETGQEGITYIFLKVATCFSNLCMHGRCLISAEMNIQTSYVFKMAH